jgi:thiamine pyrophosphate-dependent acetolactate synthase large subunit-like protein
MTTASSEHAHEHKASELFVEALENEGVEYVFAVPG